MKCLSLFSLVLGGIALVTFHTSHAYAQIITIDSPLDYGEFVLRDNNNVNTIVINTDGTYTSSPDYIFFRDPQMGEVSLTNFTPLTTLNVNIGVTSLTAAGGTANFLTVSPFTTPSVITTDVNGDVSFEVGATLSSSGSGVLHSDGTYDGIFNVTILP